MKVTPDIEEVERRLRALPKSAVLRPRDVQALTQLEAVARPKVATSRVRPGLWVPAAAAWVVAAVLVVNIVAAYFAPKYERALADSPGLGPISQRLLAGVGLREGDVTAASDSATSAGHTLKLVGGYADGLRTVLFASIDGKGLTGNPKQYGLNPGEWGVNFGDASLTDQFEHSYGGQGTTGPTSLQFQHLAWPASEVGARLTLRVTGITASKTELVLQWTVSGTVNDQMRAVPPAKSAPGPEDTRMMHEYFDPRVYDAAGHELLMQDYGYTWPKTGPALGEMTVFIHGPGRYRIQLAAALSGADQQRWVVVR